MYVIFYERTLRVWAACGRGTERVAAPSMPSPARGVASFDLPCAAARRAARRGSPRLAPASYYAMATRSVPWKITHCSIYIVVRTHCSCFGRRCILARRDRQRVRSPRRAPSCMHDILIHLVDWILLVYASCGALVRFNVIIWIFGDVMMTDYQLLNWLIEGFCESARLWRQRGAAVSVFLVLEIATVRYETGFCIGYSQISQFARSCLGNVC